MIAKTILDDESNHDIKNNFSAISLFSGAGGLDIGFIQAGFHIQWANDFDRAAVETYRHNIGNHIKYGDIHECGDELNHFKGIDCLFGGPPCQGFSIAGKMSLSDPRSELVKTFMRTVGRIKPRCFLMENVKALGVLPKFLDIRNELKAMADSFGYHTEIVVLNAKYFGVPQSRERMFFIGFQKESSAPFENLAKHYVKKQVSVKEAIRHLGPYNTDINPKTCNAAITIAKKPVLRKSPYTGMLFNGLGRPLNPDFPCTTLPASMGGNKTPIIDDQFYYGDSTNWIEEYHVHLKKGGKPYHTNDVPSFLRRLTIKEARVLHTFPEKFQFKGTNSAIYKQIGNSVPCNMAKVLATIIAKKLNQ